MKLRYPVIGVAAAALVAYAAIADAQSRLGTLVTILLGSSAVSATNPLPVAPVASGVTLGAVEILGSNGVNKASVNGLGQVAVDATVSASVTGFTANNNYGTLTATASSSASTALPSGGGDSVRMTNMGTAAVSCVFATGAATGTASKTIVQPGSSVVRGVGSWDHVACIDQTGSASNLVVLEGGSGLGNDSGGGSSGGGGGGDVNLTEILGSAPSLTNPLWVFPATGATFPVSGTFWQATQPVSGTFWQATQPVSGAASSFSDGWDVSTGITTASAASVGGVGSVNAKLRLMTSQLDQLHTDVTSPIPPCSASPCTTVIGAVVPFQGTTALSATNPSPVAPNPYPVGATPITASATGTTGATTATLAGTSGKTTYICGYSIRANATAATTVTNTITGVITATLSSIMWIAPLASGLGIDEQIFSPCIPASGTNQAIAIVSGAPGSGGTVSSKGWGYQL